MLILAQIPWPQMGVIAALVVVMLAMLTYLWRCRNAEMGDRAAEREWRAKEGKKQREWQGNHMSAQIDAMQQVALNLRGLQDEQKRTIQDVVRTCPGPKHVSDNSSE